MQAKLLSGVVEGQDLTEDDFRRVPTDIVLQELRDQVRQLDSQLRLERKKTAVVEDGARELRAILEPLYRAMQKLFGEMDAMGVEARASVSEQPREQGIMARWDAIKARHPGRIAEAIDILLAHGTMNMSQLAAAMKMDRSNCSRNLVPKLRQLGLITPGREFSLKAL